MAWNPTYYFYHMSLSMVNDWFHLIIYRPVHVSVVSSIVLNCEFPAVFTCIGIFTTVNIEFANTTIHY